MIGNNDFSKMSETSVNGAKMSLSTGLNIHSNAGSKETLISVRGISKKFCRSLKSSYAYGLRDIASEVLGISRHSEQLRKGEFWAIQDISFDVKKGDSLGLIGVNGSGKTTLLRIMGGLIKPDTGSIIVRGRVAALIALGAGFNPILTGRENVYINMSILGLRKDDIDQKFDAVLRFAEIWDAIDAPVRTYSSGMRARLGFACAIYTNPEILLIDEVLAVGDFKFRTKCYRQLASMREQGVSFILVSHSTSNILSNCDIAAYLARGTLAAFGKTEEVVRQYETDMLGTQYSQADGEPNKEANQMVKSLASAGEIESSLRIESIKFLDADRKPLPSIKSGQPLTLSIICSVSEPIKEVSLNVLIRSLSDTQSTHLFLQSNKDVGFIPIIEAGTTVFDLALPQCGLISGSYSMKLNVAENGSFFNILDIIESVRFSVSGSDSISQCSYFQPRSWAIHDDKGGKTLPKNISVFLQPPSSSKAQKEKYFLDNFPKEAALIRRIRAENLSYCGFPKLETICQAIAFLQSNQVEGSYIEAGCALGGSAVLIASMKPRHVALKVFDVFGTIPAPSDRDKDDAHQRYAEIAIGHSKGLGSDQYYGYIENLIAVVENNIQSFDLNLTTNNIHLVKGLFKDTIQIEEAIAFAHIDCDWYDSVGVCIERISPNIAINGIMLFDDYGSYEGCKEAVDTWLETDSRFKLERVDRSALVRRIST